MVRHDISADEGARLLAEAMALHRAGRLVEADDAYARCLARVPAHAEALRLRGILARERGQLDASARWLRKATAAVPGAADAPAELGLTYLAAGCLALADGAFRQALQRDPSSVKAQANLGALHLHRGHLQAAMEIFRGLLDRDAADLEIRCNLASALTEAGRGPEALACLDTGADLAPGQPWLQAVRGALLVGMEDYAAAVPVLESALEQQPADDLALINLATARQALGHQAAALEVLARAVAINPDNARATADLVQLLAARDQPEAALECSGDFLARHPGERLVLAAHAQALRAAGRVAEARHIVDLERLVSVTELTSPRAWDDLQDFNGALAAGILADPSLAPGPRSKSTRAGLQSGELDLDASPALAAWRESVQQAVARLLQHWRSQGLGGHPAMAPARERWTLRAWATVLEAGGYQTAHMHPLAWLSGVYYVECPAGLAQETLASGGGCLEFGPLPERLPVAVEPESRRVEPRPGRLVLFPGYFYHRTLPFAARGRRISMAFDVMPLGLSAT